MLFKRKIEQDLEKWYLSLQRKKKALMLKGPRQVGKTTSIKHFLESHYENVLVINFKKEKSAKEIFNGDLDTDTLLKRLTVRYPNFPFIPGKTALFFDEIQDCNSARGCLKFMMEDGRFDVACSGSLLGIAGYNREGSAEVSVGSEYPLEMHSLDFEEFLWAKGIPTEIIDSVKSAFENKTEVDPFVHEEFSKLFREYICLGGMPEVIQIYLDTSDLHEAHLSKSGILDGYRSDFAKHLNENGEEKVDRSLLAKILFVYNSIPSQLASDRGRFVVSHLGKDARRSDYDAAIQWLSDAGLLLLCHNIVSPSLPLDGYKRNGYFKLYFRDFGLFLSMLPYYVTENLYFGNNELGVYSGAIYENVVADALSKNGFTLFYYRKDTGLEIDFIEEFKGEPILVEVKATNGDTKAARTVISDKSNSVNKVVKITSSNLGYNGTYLTIPHYMAFLLKPDSRI